MNFSIGLLNRAVFPVICKLLGIRITKMFCGTYEILKLHIKSYQKNKHDTMTVMVGCFDLISDYVLIVIYKSFIENNQQDANCVRKN